MFLTLLKQGKIIIVKDKSGYYATTEYYYKDNAIWHKNSVDCKHLSLNENPKLFEELIMQYLKENFTVIIK